MLAAGYATESTGYETHVLDTAEAANPNLKDSDLFQEIGIASKRIGCVSAKQTGQTDSDDMLAAGYATESTGYQTHVLDTAEAANPNLKDSDLVGAGAAKKSSSVGDDGEANDTTLKICTMSGKDIAITVDKMTGTSLLFRYWVLLIFVLHCYKMAATVATVKAGVAEQTGVESSMQDLYADGSEDPLTDDNLVSGLLPGDLYLVVKGLPYDGDMAVCSHPLPPTFLQPPTLFRPP
jgi:hypothetical protein